MRTLVRFLRDRRGVSAVEFALIAPVLAAVLVMGFDGWMATRQALDMRTALQTGSRYYQTGGADDEAALALALAAWPARPAGGVLSVSRSCRCSAQVAACDVTCPGSVVPSTFVTLTASSAFSGALSPRQLTESEVLRVR